MELETNLKDEDQIRLLEEEIFQLKQKLEVSKVVSLNQNNIASFKNSTALFGVVDSDFNVLSINDQWEDSLSESHGKIHGKKCYSAFCGLNEPCTGCNISANVTNRLVWYFIQPQLEGKDRACRRSKITPANDIEPIELTIKESDLFYEQLFESTGDSLLILDCKGRILKFTKKLCEMLSYTMDEFSCLTIFDIDDPTNSLTFDERVVQLEREKGAIFETDLISKSGNLIPVECSSSPIKYHNKTVFFLAIRNIEKRKIAQKELLESEIRFRSLVENATDMVMRFDKEHRHVFANSATLQVLGIPPEAFIGKTHQEMGFPDDLCELWEEEMDKVFESGIPDVIDFSIEAKGREISFEWQLIPEFDSEDEIPFLLAVARDVSKRTMSEKALEEALKTKDKFFSIIAHDLRNPFGSLRTLSEYLQNNEDLSKEEIKEFAEIIHTSACQGYDLLENLLEWSRSQRGNIKWQPQEFDLVDSIDSNIRLIQANIHKKQININFKAEKSYYVFADKYMIDTIIRNLLANAVKFTYMNGNIEIEILEQEEQYCVSIKDDGKGITKSNQSKLFDLDNQYSSVGTAMETGTGLGLILCKEFIDANNGNIWVESEGGKGSCFSFTVPKK
jgi:PAS domain S-box-containing protein